MILLDLLGDQQLLERCQSFLPVVQPQPQILKTLELFWPLECPHFSPTDALPLDDVCQFDHPHHGFLLPSKTARV
jgi:hypothetical protein